MRIPVLDESQLLFDWPQGTYTPAIKMNRQKVEMHHEVVMAPGLLDAVEEGNALLAVELRSPRTLLSKMEISRESNHSFDLVVDEIAEESFLVPGIVSSGDLDLAASDLNDSVWDAEDTISIPPGWWLARASVRRITPLLQSLLRFRKNIRLGDGQMSVAEANDGAQPYFQIDLAENLYAHKLHSRDVHISALIAAFALLPKSSLAGEGRHAESLLAQQLRARFENAKPEPIPDWDDPNFDPALAATSLEAFHITVEDEE